MSQSIASGSPDKTGSIREVVNGLLDDMRELAKTDNPMAWSRIETLALEVAHIGRTVSATLEGDHV